MTIHIPGAGTEPSEAGLQEDPELLHSVYLLRV